MSRLIIWCWVLIAAAGCGRPAHEGEHGHGDQAHGGHEAHGAAEELPSQSVTAWTAQTELFMEHRALVAGQPTSFAVHLTILENFKPVETGSVTLIFTTPDGASQKFEAPAPTSPGIFRPVATLAAPGRYLLSVALSTPQDVHHLEPVEVYPDAHAAQHAAPPEAERATIAFLKEQQWPSDFRVDAVTTRTLAQTIPAQGQVRAASSSTVPVAAAASGVLVEPPGSAPLLGGLVPKDRILAVIQQEDGRRVEVPAPVTGVVALLNAGPGQRVSVGWKLCDLVDISRVWVEARVYEPDVPKLAGVAKAIIELPGTDLRLPTRRLISTGGALDAVSRTVPVVFEVENAEGHLKLGSAVTAHLVTRSTVNGIAIPRSAVVDEDGPWVAYVQVEGEAFERRKLTLGIREGDWVEVVDGLKPGEHVVTRGAYLVRLAASSSTIPAHGHAH